MDRTALWMLAWESLSCSCGSERPLKMAERDEHFAGCPKNDADDVAATLQQLHDDTLERAAVWLEKESVCAMDVEELGGGPFTLHDRVTLACAEQWAKAFRAMKSSALKQSTENKG